MELLSAGHAPLFIYWLKHDRFDKMEAQGLPLGISPEFLSEPPQILPFASGDLLVLCHRRLFRMGQCHGRTVRQRAPGKERSKQTAINQRPRLSPLSIRMCLPLRAERHKTTT